MIQKQKEFYWDDAKEPHLQRRKDILSKYPQVRKLFGVNPRLRWLTLVLVAVQLTIGLFIGQLGWVPFLLITYFVGATIAQALFLAIHEITHNLAFKKPAHNNWLSFIANIPIVLPFSYSFKIYHGLHHWQQGKEGVDTDIPTHIEAKVFRGFLGKTLWFLNQILFYAFRPMVVRPIKFEKWHLINFTFQAAAMAVYVPFAGWNGLLFLALSIFLAGSLHPTAGHFISEHYVFNEGQETYSYYGPLNLLTWNVGYHNEHHDFPNIPGSRLPELKKLAPEFYDNLHYHKSWVAVVFRFLFTPSMTLYQRTKRN